MAAVGFAHSPSAPDEDTVSPPLILAESSDVRMVCRRIMQPLGGGRAFVGGSMVPEDPEAAARLPFAQKQPVCTGTTCADQVVRPV